MFPNHRHRDPRSSVNHNRAVQRMPSEESFQSVPRQEYFAASVHGSFRQPWHQSYPITHAEVSYPLHWQQRLYGPSQTLASHRPRTQYHGNWSPFQRQHGAISRQWFPPHQPYYASSPSDHLQTVHPSSLSNFSYGPRIPSRARRGPRLHNPVNTSEATQLSADVEDKPDNATSITRTSTPEAISELHLGDSMLPPDTEEEHPNLREKLIDQLRNGTYQCLVCISPVRQRDQIWSCSTCFYIYHLSCIKMWADKCRKGAVGNETAEVLDAPWRCPSCQTEYKDYGDMMSYFCFCRRIRNPEYHPAKTNIPHSCDEICGKLRPKNTEHADDLSPSVDPCTHPCTELCHPGPCPPCVASVTLSCPCGRTKRAALCGDPAPGPCGQLCRKDLCRNDNELDRCVFGAHKCLYVCHRGSCPSCGWILEADCYCGSEYLSVACGSMEAGRLRLNEESLARLQTACDEFESTLLQLETVKHKIPGDSDNLSPSLDEGVPISGDGPLGKGDSTSHSLLNAPPDLYKHVPVEDAVSQSPQSGPTQLPLPAPVFLGECFSCGKTCGRTLTCGHHTCSEACHSGECKRCALDPSLCLACPCGRVALSKLVSSGDVSGDRTSCMDPVPTCPNVCDRPNPICGHPCPEKCHVGPCPPCKQSLTIKCRCGRTSKELTCVAFSSMVENGSMELQCERHCNKKKACGRHKCKKKCCQLSVHPCDEVCGRRLSCGQHNCEEPCHAGSCGTCWRGVIYTEITCRCGFSVLQPPQPCGCGPPDCPRPCDRPHACDHPVRHTCHNEPTCPPCTVLLTKECPGGHGVQFSMPCFQPVLSCGRVCGHPLPNCSHTCQRNCHGGNCLEPTASGESVSLVCTQPCQKPRPDCGHPCSLPCHADKNLTCLQAASAGSKKLNENGNSRSAALPRCRYLVDVICPCGRRKDKQMCYQVQLKQCILLQNDGSSSVRLGENQKLVQHNLAKEQSEPLPLLACDSTCAKVAELTASRSNNGRFADTSSWTRGLGLNSERSLGDSMVTTGKLPFEKPDYSKWLRSYALHNYAFAVSVERQLHSMVLQILKSADTDTARTVSHHFPPMKEKRRRFIHELSEFYGIESHSMDPEPGRHVMVLARRGETKFPGGAADNRGSLTALLQHEFPDTVQLIEGVRVPNKAEVKKHAPSNSTTRFSYAQILSARNEPP